MDADEIKQWRRDHAGDPCECGHMRVQHYALDGSMRRCTAEDCRCNSFGLDKVKYAPGAP